MIRVLVVDGDLVVAEALGHLVGRTTGFAFVGTARSGADAFSLVAELDPDLLLVGAGLPDMTGADVLATLRAVGNDAGVIRVSNPQDHGELATRLHQAAADLGLPH